MPSTSSSHPPASSGDCGVATAIDHAALSSDVVTSEVPISGRGRGCGRSRGRGRVCVPASHSTSPDHLMAAGVIDVAITDQAAPNSDAAAAVVSETSSRGRGQGRGRGRGRGRSASASVL